MKLTRTDRNKIERKIEIAIDKLIDIQNMGILTDRVQRVLDLLNSLSYDILNNEVTQ